MNFWITLLLVMGSGIITIHNKSNNSPCNSAIWITQDSRNSKLQFQPKKSWLLYSERDMSFFWIESIPPGSTINSHLYCEILIWLRCAIQNKRKGMLTRQCSSSRGVSKQNSTKKNFKWEDLIHPPYSPNLASSDFHLFIYLKRQLARQ